MNEPRASTEVITSAQDNYDALRNVSTETPCPYLPDRPSRTEAYFIERLDGRMYEHLMGLGFRRNGRVVYRPRCRTCEECRQLRIPVDEFTPTRSMRRVWRLNQDVRVEIGEAEPTDEKFTMFARYLDSQHDGTMPSTYDVFEEFIYDSPLRTCEFDYRLGERLIGVSVVDVCPGGLSSVYMYFDPDHGKRSLGTYSVLREVEHCRQQGLPYYYLGFFVAGCRTMVYKSRFRPNEILVRSDRWVTLRE